jgi:hypothetical protein
MKFINRKFVWLILSSIVFSFQVNAQERSFDESALSAKGKQAFQKLLKVELFALGPISSSARTSDGELALDILIKEKKAISSLKSLIKNATPEGGLYALFGLRKLKADSFDERLKNFKSRSELAERGEGFDKIPKAEVRRMDGCESFTENRLKVADEIVSGKFDTWLSGEWIKLKKS